MSPCNPLDLTVNVPPGPAGPAIQGFGVPFAPTLPNFAAVTPGGFPEDLVQILDILQFVLPSGTIKPALNLNFGKDIFDGIMKLLDQFVPFLMLYKFFLPLLDLIICIIEVLCAIPNPFKLPKALRRLFRVCLPNFLAMFPIFALIVMILSLLFLILSLVKYIIGEVEKLLAILLKNIKTISKALTKADSPSILGAVQKIGMILCAFQNLFVILSIFKIIIDSIKDILKLLFAIPPCDDGDNGNLEKCCTPDVCPSFIKNCDGLVRETGKLQYLNQVAQGLGTLPDGFPSSFPVNFFNSNVRAESWQFYDPNSSVPEAFWNITNAYDLPPGITQIFFPTDATYQDGTPYNQVPYRVDLRLFYNPSNWGRNDPLGARFIRVNNCIVLNAPTQQLKKYDNSFAVTPTGVLNVSGGTVTEDNGVQIFIDGSNATLTNFIHKPAEIVNGVPVLFPTDGYQFSDVTYTFHINYEVLIQKALITLGCMPIVALDRQFINSVYGGNAGANFALLNDLVNNTSGSGFPDIDAAQTCLNAALSALRNDISVEGAANFQAMTTICLNKLSDDTRSAIDSLIGIGYDPYNSQVTLTPKVQFTTSPIKVQVQLKETNGQSITAGIPQDVAATIAQRIVPVYSFGTMSDFVYDGYTSFNAEITSLSAGKGTLQVSFDGKIISTATVPADLSQSPVITPVVLEYSFVFSPSSFPGSIDGNGVPRRDATDVAGESGNGS